MPKAKLLLRLENPIYDSKGNLIGKLSVRILKVPPDRHHPHGVKYSLQFAKWTGNGYDNDFLRYDNHAKHGDHKHIRGQRLPYQFRGVRQLINDFNQDAIRLLGMPLI